MHVTVVREMIVAVVLATNVWAQKAERIAYPEGNPSASGPTALPAISELVKKLPGQEQFFDVAGCHAFLITPKNMREKRAESSESPAGRPALSSAESGPRTLNPARQGGAAAMPWVWYAPTLAAYPNTLHAWMFKQFLQKGIAIAGVDVGESMGNPRGRAVFKALHKTLTETYGLSKHASLMPQSRGGLMLYNWAAENPTHVACIAGIYPVCDMSSWPGLKKACRAYGVSREQLAAVLSEHNPIDRLAPLAKAGVPILHIHGDSDTVVPLERNSAELARRYRRVGGKMKLIVVPGKGHQEVPEFVRCQELVDFVSAHACVANKNEKKGR